ncbi:MAG: VOC family protein [Acidobacteriota bacterium]
MANPFVRIELQTKDVEKSKKFYTGMFDWKLEEFPGMDYTITNVGEGTGGGMMKKPIPGDPDNWLPYIMVDDVAASTKKAKSLGATIARDVTEVPDMGWFSVIIDPIGDRMCILKGAKHFVQEEAPTADLRIADRLLRSTLRGNGLQPV